MNRSRMKFFFALLFLSLCGFAGCGGSDVAIEPVYDDEFEDEEPTLVSGDIELPVQATKASDVESVAEMLGLKVKKNGTTPEFNAPYPQRQDPFARPIELNVRAPTEEQRRIELRGFLTLDTKAKVLLSINDELVSLEVGESSQGIEVLEIDSPNVLLQQGKLRWNESLYDGL